MDKRRPYNTIPRGIIEFFAKSLKKNPDSPAWKMFDYITNNVKKASNQKPFEQAWVVEWLMDNNLNYELSDVWTFQAANSQLERVCSKAAAKNWMNTFEEVGMVMKIHDGTKGHGSLYIVMPDLLGVNSVEDSDPQTNQDGGQFDGQWGSDSSPIRVSDDTCDDPHLSTYLIHTTETAGDSPKGSPPLRCPECGSENLEIPETSPWVSCRSCGQAGIHKSLL